MEPVSPALPGDSYPRCLEAPALGLRGCVSVSWCGYAQARCWAPRPPCQNLHFDPILGAAGVAGWNLSETLPLVFSVWTLGQLPPLWNTGTAIFLPSEAEESPHVIKNFSLPSNLLVFVTPSLVTKLA